MRVCARIKWNKESCIPTSDIANTEGMGVDKCTVQADDGRVTVGLTGYPNVGKSSTINALFGSKKTAVAPTPGKTKHFQTLNISNDLTLCDCPGLVLPRYAQSKSEMVAAGMVFVGWLLSYSMLLQVLSAVLLVSIASLNTSLVRNCMSNADCCEIATKVCYAKLPSLQVRHHSYEVDFYQGILTSRH